MTEIREQNLKTGKWRMRKVEDWEKRCAVRGCNQLAEYTVDRKDRHHKARHRVEASFCKEHWCGAMAFACFEHPYTNLADDWKDIVLKTAMLEKLYRYKEYVQIVDLVENRVVEVVPYDDYERCNWYEPPEKRKKA